MRSRKGDKAEILQRIPVRTMYMEKTQTDDHVNYTVNTTQIGIFHKKA
jgi:hypothetical protein